MNAHTKETPVAPREGVFEHLEKVLASRLFQGAERSTKLLHFLVEQTLNGKTDRLKEYTLGTEALGKGSSFDPRTDPIVRAEASRLRTRLDKYYATDGQADTLVIVLPKGSYVPQFEQRSLPSAKAPAPERQGPFSSKRTGLLAFGFGLAACILMVALWSFWRAPRADGPISLAVLPFANMSGDASQEFFSDGMTEEITSALAKVQDLRVVGRTSAFQFKGQNQDLRSIGQQLHATHLIEGSVRKAGERVRITVQLIKADDGTHIWTEDYDRNLTDIFAIQEDIARAITTSLRAPLGLKPGESLVNNRDIDAEFYEKYLRAKALYAGRGRDLPNVAQAAALCEEIVAKYPGYAPAWQILGAAYWVSGSGAATRAQANEFRTKAEAATQRAVQLDPNLAPAYVNLAVLAWSRGNALEADELVAKATTLDSTGNAKGTWLSMAGRVKESLPLLEKALAIEPFTPATSLMAANERWLNGQNDAAIALAKTLRPIDRAPLLAKIYASMGRYGEAADALMEIADDPNSAAAQAARLLRTAPAKTASPEKLPRLTANLEFVYLYIGAPDGAIGSYERMAENGYFNPFGTCCFWHPSYAAVRKTERFKALMRKTGLVDYWLAKGWPEFCRPTTGDDFECQ